MSELVPRLTRATGLTDRDVRAIISNAPSRYKTYEIAKRNGGTRTISQPAREVKALQRVIMAEILSTLPVHPSASAYRPGMSIADNAGAHRGDGPILKFDFANFFPSILARDWQLYCEKMSLFADAEDVELSTRILFQRRKRSTVFRLAIGAPSSPSLSNVLMNEFDTEIARLVGAEHVTYTRYADDLTFSARRVGFLREVEKTLRRVIRNLSSPSLQINEEKTVLATRKYKRVVTGLVLTNDGKVSVGHERKRNIRAALHWAQHGKLDQAQLMHLSGLLAFVKDVEPLFFERMCDRYGMDLIRQIRSFRDED